MVARRTDSDKASHVLKVGDVEFIGKWGEFTEELHALISLNLKSVRDGLIHCSEQCDVPKKTNNPAVLYTYYRAPTIADISVTDLSPIGGDDEPTGEFYTVTADGQLIITAEISPTGNLDDMLEILRPFMWSYGLEILELSDAGALKIRVLEESVERYVIRDIVQVLRSVRLLLNIGHLDLSTTEGVYLAAASGNTDVLIGSPEGEHFDAKRKGYSLHSDHQKFEFSLDLASFANTETGGVILLGVATKKDAAGRDVVDRVLGCRPGSLNLEQMAAVADRFVVPPIEGLDFRLATALRGEQVCVIFVPPQPAYMQPFLVRGGPVEQGKISGSAVTVPHRRGDRKWALSPEVIHSLLVSARAALNTPHKIRRRVPIPAKIINGEGAPERHPTR